MKIHYFSSDYYSNYYLNGSKAFCGIFLKGYGSSRNEKEVTCKNCKKTKAFKKTKRLIKYYKGIKRSALNLILP